jgi:protein O-GlcNAc transferase
MLFGHASDEPMIASMTSLDVALQHLQSEEFSQAEALCCHILATGMVEANVFYLLGLALQKQDKQEEAIQIFENFLEKYPSHAEPYFILACLLDEQGRLAEAISHYKNAIELFPNFAEAHNNLGLAFKSLGRIEEAHACYSRALEIAPDSIDARLNLGVLLHEQEINNKAVQCYLAVLKAKPELVELYYNLGLVFRGLGFTGDAIDCCRKVLQHNPLHHKAHSQMLLCMDYRSEYTPAEIFAEHVQWAKQHVDPLIPYSTYDNTPIPDRKLKIGYFSSNFRTHSLAYFFEPLMTLRDRNAFEIYCYEEGTKPDHVTKHYRTQADQWRTVAHLSEEELCGLVRADGIDIFVDLVGHTGNNRLLAFARKPAPIQVTYLGYLGTTGTNRIDYLFTDPWADPPDQPAFYSEELIRLSSGFHVYLPPDDAPEVGSLPSLRKEYITFGSFNALPKMTDEVVELWAAIMAAVPHSRLLLKSGSLAEEESCTHLYARFSSNGIEPERLMLAPWRASRHDHLDLYNEIDIALDPFPYNGVTTTCEAIWMGVPVITLAGDSMVRRIGVSMLSRVGLFEYIASTVLEYFSLAVELALNADRLSDLRQELRPLMAASRLCDVKAFTLEVEENYRLIWRRWCQQAGRGIS